VKTGPIQRVTFAITSILLYNRDARPDSPTGSGRRVARLFRESWIRSSRSSHCPTGNGTKTSVFIGKSLIFLPFSGPGRRSTAFEIVNLVEDIHHILVFGAPAYQNQRVKRRILPVEVKSRVRSESEFSLYATESGLLGSEGISSGGLVSPARLVCHQYG